jgi:hypothetical protein
MRFIVRSSYRGIHLGFRRVAAKGSPCRRRKDLCLHCWGRAGEDVVAVVLSLACCGLASVASSVGGEDWNGRGGECAAPPAKTRGVGVSRFRPNPTGFGVFSGPLPGQNWSAERLEVFQLF